MSKNQRLAPEVKEQILNRIRNEGVPVKQAAADHGLSDRTIYEWLKKDATGGPTIGEITKWRKEREELLTLDRRADRQALRGPKKEVTTSSRLSKSALVRRLGRSRSSLYYQSKKLKRDWTLKQRIESVLHEHPSYGHRRIALSLGFNKKRIRRVMRKFGLKPYRRRGRKYKKIKDYSLKYPNLLLTTVPSYRHHIWVSDFTYLGFHSSTIYVGTVMDIWSREVVGVSILTTHSATLTIQALWSALLHHPRPEIFHSDNGAEYEALAFRSLLAELGIRISRSRPRSPWENGYQESFYSQFKVELGDPNRLESLGELVAEIYRLIHYYNTRRIHSVLRMAPLLFTQRLLAS